MIDKHQSLRYPIPSDQDRRGSALRTPSGPKGSSGKEKSLGAAGILIGLFNKKPRFRAVHHLTLSHIYGIGFAIAQSSAMINSISTADAGSNLFTICAGEAILNSSVK